VNLLNAFLIVKVYKDQAHNKNSFADFPTHLSHLQLVFRATEVAQQVHLSPQRIHISQQGQGAESKSQLDQH